MQICDYCGKEVTGYMNTTTDDFGKLDLCKPCLESLNVAIADATKTFYSTLDLMRNFAYRKWLEGRPTPEPGHGSKDDGMTP